MKTYLTCWSLGNQHQDDFTYNSYKLSAHYLKKNYGEVSLITDSQGAKFLDKIDFSSIDTSLDSMPRGIGRIIWSLGKIKAYEIICRAGDPFIHVDHDAFIINRLPHKILEKPVFAQHEEVQIFDAYELQKYHQELPVKKELEKYESNNAPNMGIFGGSNLDFIYNYSKCAYSIATEDANLTYLQRTRLGYPWSAATLFEQYYLKIKAMENNVEISFLFKSKKELDSAHKNGYIHIMNNRPIPMEKMRDMVYTALCFNGLEPKGTPPWESP